MLAQCTHISMMMLYIIVSKDLREVATGAFMHANKDKAPRNFLNGKVAFQLVLNIIASMYKS